MAKQQQKEQITYTGQNHRRIYHGNIAYTEKGSNIPKQVTNNSQNCVEQKTNKSVPYI
jgi:hypothetical protein